MKVADYKATDAEKEKADFLCDGIYDHVELKAAMESPILQSKFGHRDWFGRISTFLSDRYHNIEGRVIQTLGFVALTKDNAKTYSYELASILKDSSSAFASVMTELIRGIQVKLNSKYNFGHYPQFLIGEIPNITYRIVLIHSLFPMVLLPFSALSDFKRGQPAWWKAYNHVKHTEVTQHSEGNLANALGSIAALALLGRHMGCFVRTRLFVNVGVAYPPTDPAISGERILFDMG